MHAWLHIPGWEEVASLARRLARSNGWLLWKEEAGADRFIQTVLTEVHRRGGYLHCHCRVDAPRFYVARHAGLYRLCRYPLSGRDHDRNCPFFDSTDRRAPRAADPGDRIVLPLGRRIEAASTAPAALRRTGAGASRARGTLAGLFRMLWERAGLNVHRPQAPSTWKSVREALMDRAARMVWGGEPLHRALAVPIPPSRADARAGEIADTCAVVRSAITEHARVLLIAPLWSWLPPKPDRGKDHAIYDLAIGRGGDPYRLHVVSPAALFERLGSSWPRAAAAVAARSPGGSAKSAALEADERARIVLIAIARPRETKKGVLLGLEDAGLDMLTRAFIPCDSAHEIRLARDLSAHRRHYRKPLSASGEWGERIPDFELLDVGPDPVPLEVFGLSDPDYMEARAQKVEMYRRNGRRFWQWDAAAGQSFENALKTLPRAGERRDGLDR